MTLEKVLFAAVLSVTTVACGTTSSNGGGDDGGGGGGGGGGGSGSNGGSGTTPSNWTEMPLSSGHDDDAVTAIYFASPSQGLIATAGSESSSGGIFNAAATSVTGISFDGSSSNDLEFYGFAKTPTGYYAYTDIEETVVGDSTGKFSDLGANGTQAGNVSQVLGAYVTATDTVLVTKEALWQAASVPGASADYTAIFAPPPADPTVPDDFPSTDCQDGPSPNDPVFINMASVAISSDGKTIVYAAASDADGVPEVCVSTNGGSVFLPTELPGTSAVAPSGIVFPNPAEPSTLIVYSAQTDNDAGANFIMRSTNGGTSFQPVAIPSSLASKSMEFDYAFFAPDGQHGWIIGLDDDADLGLALVTTDGGQTWAEDTTGIANVDPANEERLRAGFALDATHVWIGGDHGVLFAYTPQ